MCLADLTEEALANSAIEYAMVTKLLELGRAAEFGEALALARSRMRLEGGELSSLHHCAHVYHERCLKAHILARLEENDLPILCPDHECRVEISGGDVEKILKGTPAAEVYQHRMLELALSTI